MKKIFLVLTILFVSSASAFVVFTPSATAFRSGSGTRLSFEAKYVDFDKLNLS